MDDRPIDHISISGPTLASLLHRFSCSPSDCDGLLFGHLSSSPSLHDDDDDSSSPPSAPLSLSISSLLCLSSPVSFYDPLARLDLPLLRRALSSHPDSLLLGWFSARRLSPLRPSMREFAVTSSLTQFLQTLTPPAQSPCIFLLLSSSLSPNLAVHTHEYRAFQMQHGKRGVSLQPRSVRVANVGPGFRGHYGAFSPESGFPWVPCGGEEVGGAGSLKEQKMVDGLAEGFEVERLRKMVRTGVSQYTVELEDLYGKMLARLANLAGLVEKSSAKVVEQESQNIKLRSKIAGLE